jgi:hypothetical protein
MLKIIVLGFVLAAVAVTLKIRLGDATGATAPRSGGLIGRLRCRV